MNSATTFGQKQYRNRNGTRKKEARIHFLAHQRKTNNSGSARLVKQRKDICFFEHCHENHPTALSEAGRNTGSIRISLSMDSFPFCHVRDQYDGISSAKFISFFGGTKPINHNKNNSNRQSSPGKQGF